MKLYNKFLNLFRKKVKVVVPTYNPPKKRVIPKNDISIALALRANNRSFEPKMDFRFLVKFVSGLYLPSYDIHTVTSPAYANGHFNWPISIEMYDPISESTSQIIQNYIQTKNTEPINFDIELLGPVGDVVSKWEIRDCKIDYVCYNTNSFSWKSSKVVNIRMGLTPTSVI